MTELPVPAAVQLSPDGSTVRLLDQTLLPAEERWLDLTTAEQVAESISSLRVRGAPAIGVAGAFGLALGVRDRIAAGGDAKAAIAECHAMLLETRPTGRNLGWALDRVADAARGVPNDAAADAAMAEARTVARAEARMCQAIGEAGRTLIPEEGCTVMTHCNAGALATAGLGTALAPIYVAHAEGVPVAVAACETRPVLQGARLTAWELGRAGVPVTVVTDSMAGALMANGGVALIVVGADRIAANGDVANKIGTYGLAVLAAHHGIPFYVAAPRSTIDPTLDSGADIRIEVRDESEVRKGLGRKTAPDGAGVWNPAFDVTPHALITALITDGGILREPYTASIAELLQGGGVPSEPGDSP